MNHIKATYTKALAILLSFAMLMTGQPVLAESAVTEPQTEAILKETSDSMSLGGEMPDMPDGIPLEEESEPETGETVDSSDQELPDEPKDTVSATQSPDDGAAPAETPDSEVEPEETPEAPGDSTEEPPPEFSAEDDETGEVADTAVLPETQPDEPLTDVEPEAEPGEDDNPIRAAIESGGYAYLRTVAETKAYSTADMQEHVFTLFPGAVVLAAAYIEQDGGNALEVWFYTADYLFMTAYVAEHDMDSIPLSAGEVDSLAASAAYGLAFTGDEQRILFVADGEAPGTEPIEAGTEPPPPEAEPPVSDVSAEPTPEIVEAETAVQPGGFVLVFPQTRAFLGVDDTATDEECGNLNLGVFVSEAAVQVEATEQDGMGRPWYKVRYLYGADDADGSLIWTAYGTVYVLASETQETQEQDFTVTDYAFSELPVSSMRRAARADAPRMQTLSGNTGSFSAGQTKYAYSGHDSEYLQIATLKGYGAIYATPHYVDEHTVYCLEHTMNSPGVRDNATGPYAVVDLSGYEQTPGYSGIIYGEDTMHAIGWVLRHTYPFMALDRYEDSCLEWSRVAGQFAIREVIKHMEGAQYVRDYWDTLNLRDTRIFDIIQDSDGKEQRVLNQRDTTLAQQKQQAIKDAFREWIWRAPKRREALVKEYNERFNSIRPREYDGRHIVFSGMNPEITLREHQRNAVAHILYGGNTLLAHQVGAGKTFEMVAAAMESKRLGLCQKSMFVVPNHLPEQWASEFLRLYPSARILVTTKKDFETSNRKKFCARIATGDYDAIIIGHSQFEKIPVSHERQEQLLQDQIDEIMMGITELKASSGERFSIKQLERSKKQLEVKLQKLKAEERKDDVVTFEQLGVDRLYVDEAHAYKNRARRCV